VTPKARETSLHKRLAYLGIADFDYLSARVLMRHGLVFTALAKASDAFEKIMKLNLILDAKISRNQDLEPDEVKTYLHNLRGLLDGFEDRTGMSVGSETREYFAMLQEATKRRYPEYWTSYRAQLNIPMLDEVYAQFRNVAVANFPAEERDRARSFGTFIGDVYTSEMIEQIKKLGGDSPWDLLAFENQALARLDLDHERKAPPIPQPRP
jgi:hypothetical protein